jgi:hypothetical protein
VDVFGVCARDALAPYLADFDMGTRSSSMSADMVDGTQRRAHVASNATQHEAGKASPVAADHRVDNVCKIKK